MTTTITAPTHITHDEAAALATAAYDQLLALLDDLEPSDWDAPTDCTGWDVRHVVGHLVGAAKGHASVREFIRQARHGRRHRHAFAGNMLDAMNDLQVREHVALEPPALLAELRRVAPRAVAKRVSLPRPLRRMPVPIDAGVGSMAAGLPRRVTLRYLNDVVLTRDVFLHRIDIARAADRPPVLDGDADRRIVEDVVADWAAAHGQPFLLRLDGPAGGAWQVGESGAVYDLETSEFCRIVSGRRAGEGLLDTPVLF